MSLSSGPNPLLLLRQYTIQNTKPDLLDQNDALTTSLQDTATIRFGDDRFARDTPTTFLRSNSDSDYYTLSALLHFLDHRDEGFYEYMKMANTMGLQAISFGDRTAVVDYLTGKSPENAVPGSAASGSLDAESAAAGSKHAGSDIAASAASDPKRPRVRAAPGSVSGAADGSVPAGTAANDIARDIMRRERVLVTPSTALSSSKSFAHVVDLAKALFPSKHGGAAAADSLAKGADGKSNAGGAGSAAAAPGAGAAVARRAAHRKRRNPIIVVPAATTAMLNMYNIKALLLDHQFVESRAVMETAGPKPRELTVEHAMLSTGQTVKFRVVDSVQDFADADWDCLVCVFTQGAAWQFKNWLWKTPEEVFQNCLGFYPKYQDERLKDSTSSWNISPLNIERSKRHMDRAAIVGLWNNVEQYMARNKPDLLH